MRIIIRHFEKGYLCNDLRWRTWFHIGDGDDCVKEYYSFGWAKKKALRIGGECVIIPEGMTYYFEGGDIKRPVIVHGGHHVEMEERIIGNVKVLGPLGEIELLAS